MHSCKLISNLCANKVLCCHAEVVKNFQCCNHRLYFLQRDWHEQNFCRKSNQLNEARGIGQRSLDPLFLVRGRGLGTRLGGASSSSKNHLHSILRYAESSWGFTEIKFIESKFAGGPMGINAWNTFVLRVEHPYNFLSVASQLASA